MHSTQRFFGVKPHSTRHKTGFVLTKVVRTADVLEEAAAESGWATRKYEGGERGNGSRNTPRHGWHHVGARDKISDAWTVRKVLCINNDDNGVFEVPSTRL